jgi:hypothetical protein
MLGPNFSIGDQTRDFARCILPTAKELDLDWLEIDRIARY